MASRFLREAPRRRSESTTCTPASRRVGAGDSLRVTGILSDPELSPRAREVESEGTVAAEAAKANRRTWSIAGDNE